jgi:acetyl esterase/lipase
MSGWILFTFAVIGAGLVANAAWPSRGPWALIPSWVGVLLTTDLVFHHIVLQVLIVLVCAWFGALETTQGHVAIVLMVVSSLALLWIWSPALRARTIAEAVAADLDLADVAPLPRSLLLTPFPTTRKGVEVVRDIEFSAVDGQSLALDIFRPDMASDDRPALIYVHGGGFLFGDKKDQGLPLCNHMAALGWVCFNVNYRLSPGATWPDQLEDIHAAIGWVREHAADYGIDPDFIALSGNSAGGQIASMAALTATAETAVQAVVSSYSIYDLTNRHGAHNPEYLTKMIGPHVLKADPETEMEKFSAASPRDNLDRVSMPWLVIHGSDDPLVPIIEARDFFAELEPASTAMCGYAEFPGASHGFDVYYCHRAAAAVDLTARFLVSASSSSKEASRQSA